MSLGITPAASDRIVLECALTRNVKNIARVSGTGLVGTKLAVGADLTIAIIRA